MRRLTIDELIAFCNEKANNIKLKAEPEVFIQLAELLEELKIIKSDGGFTDDLLNMGFTKGFTKGYNKAIDDFVEKMKYEYGSDEIHKTIDEMAEELKAGGNNDN